MTVQNRNKISRIFLFASVSTFLLVFLYINRAKLNIIIAPFAIGILITYALEPVVSFLVGKGMKRAAAVGLVYFILIGFLVVALFYIIPILLEELNNMVEIIPLYIEYLQDLVGDYKVKYRKIFPLEFRKVADQNVIQIKEKLYQRLEHLYATILNMFAGLFSFILGPILGFYMLKDLDIIKSSFRRYLPVQYRDKVIYWLKKIDYTLGSYIRSQLIICLIISIFTTVALWLLGIDFALLIGFIAGITNVIPYFGPFLGAIPAIAVATLRYPHKIVWILVITFIIHELESGFISPYILGENVGLHPLAVILSLLIGGTFFGIWGLVLAVPITVIIKSSIFQHHQDG